MKGKPIPDALMYRAVKPGVWDVRRVAAHRMAVYLSAGWTVLIQSGQFETDAIEEVRQSEEDRLRRRAR